ncbi:hypothetical protein [Trinickia terrae]|uniref:hypothetical protein n=1 Tax=Trinickia terrae TaxID=2571161 RepID=UPI00146F653F|nr:hypothetical protein [Trinickia terrae]
MTVNDLAHLRHGRRAGHQEQPGYLECIEKVIEGGDREMRISQIERFIEDYGGTQRES